MKRLFLFLLLSLAACSAVYEDNHEHPHITAMVHAELGPGHGPHDHRISTLQFEEVDDIAKLPNDIPAKASSENVVRVALEAKEVVSEIAPNTTFMYWTFNETVPGPMIRVREGDVVELTLKNHQSSSKSHSIDLHAVNGPGGGAVSTQVAPGEEKTFRFKALNPGLYVYHCATPNVPTHMANGMYGLILVEPKDGLSEVDKEFYIMQGELYTSGSLGEQGLQYFEAQKMLDERPEYVLFNGRAKSLVDHPAKAQVGETVRMYVGNGGVSKTSNFHVIGEIFDTVYHEAGSLKNHDVQTTSIPAGGAAIVEFKVDVPGDYVLVDHALARLDRGAWGLLEVEGYEDETIFAEVK